MHPLVRISAEKCEMDRDTLQLRFEWFETMIVPQTDETKSQNPEAIRKKGGHRDCQRNRSSPRMHTFQGIKLQIPHSFSILCFVNYCTCATNAILRSPKSGGGEEDGTFYCARTRMKQQHVYTSALFGHTFMALKISPRAHAN
jgi:hypothetical protein